MDAVDRTLLRAERIIRTGATVATGAGAEQVCRVANAACRPLLVLLDAPEEMPPSLYERLDEWSAETGRLLRRYGARLAIGCGPEHWDHAGRLFSAEDLHGTGSPRALRLGPLPADTARAAAAAHGLAVGAPESAASPLARHPLALRLLADLHAAAPALAAGAAPSRAQLFGAWVDLGCLRIAERLLPPPPAAEPPAARTTAAEPPVVSGAGVRRPRAARYLAAAVAGRVHEAARRMLGPGGGALGRADFDELFPADGGWARAVRAEGLLLPVGPGYRFAHEELSEWLQGGHLDLGPALDALLGDGPEPPPAASEPGTAPGNRGSHRRGGPRAQAVPAPPPPLPRPVPRPLPHHRIGPVREALLRLAEDEQHPGALDPWLSRLVLRLDGPDAAPPGSEAYWWTANLLTSVLLRLPDARPYLPLLRALAERMACRAAESDAEPPLPLDFWTGLPLPVPELVGLLRLQVRDAGPRALDAVADLIRADPTTALPAVCGWFRDERVAATAVHLLRSHRRIALDDLTEALVTSAHPRADALLRELAVTEPSALCRAVDRWVHDPRPERHVAAAVHGPAVRPESEADRRLLGFAAETLLARDAEAELHGAALALLVADPGSRGRYLPAAAARYAAADPLLRAQDLAAALDSHPDQVLAAYAVRLGQPGEEAAAILLTLARSRPHAPGPPPPGWSATTWSAVRRPPSRSPGGWRPAPGSARASGPPCWPSPAGSPTASPPPSAPLSPRRWPSIPPRSAGNCWRRCGQPSRCPAATTRMAGYRG